jgi:hypothetical protein
MYGNTKQQNLPKNVHATKRLTGFFSTVIKLENLVCLPGRRSRNRSSICGWGQEIFLLSRVSGSAVDMSIGALFPEIKAART